MSILFILYGKVYVSIGGVFLTALSELCEKLML